MAFKKRSSSHRHGLNTSSGHGDDLMITPLLDLFVALIPFLIMSVVLSRMNVIDVGIAKPGAASQVQTEKERDISLKIYKNRAEILIDNRAVASIARTAGKEWIEATHQRLVEIKKQKLDDMKIHIEAQERISLDLLVSFMDTVRELKAADGELFKKDENGKDMKLKYLFPKVILKGVYS